MDEILEEERRDALIEMFTNTAKANVLTNAEALTIIKILESACARAQVELEERFLKAMIEGSIEDAPTPGTEE